MAVEDGVELALCFAGQAAEPDAPLLNDAEHAGVVALLVPEVTRQANAKGDAVVSQRWH